VERSWLAATTRATSNSHRHQSSPERDPLPPQRRSARRESSSPPPGALPSRYPFLPRLGGAFARCASGGRHRTGVSGPDGLPGNDPTLPVTQWETNHQTRNASVSNPPWERVGGKRGVASALVRSYRAGRPYALLDLCRGPAPARVVRWKRHVDPSAV
jgi:hypothetical protein